MKWKKLGKIFETSSNSNWNITHAQVPVADFIPDEEIIRIYYSTRSKEGASSISYFEVNASDPTQISYIHDRPVLEAGEIGTFDDCGVMPTWILDMNNLKYLYYIGWNVRNTVPYYNAVGLAISSDNGKTFKRFSKGPLWDRNYIEPFFSASICVLEEDDLFKGWYLSCTDYKKIGENVEPRYHIKYAESTNGIDWVREGKVAIDYKSANEAGIVKASVMKDDIYKMWYSYRNFENYRNDPNNSYKIGYAESSDGKVWDRMDEEVGIVLGNGDFDSVMMCYPHVLDVLWKRYMFYNGNGFGKSGIGCAVLER